MKAAATTVVRFFRDSYALEKEISRGHAQQVEISLAALNRWAGKELRLRDLSDSLMNRWLRDQCEAGRHAPKTIKHRRGDVLAVWRYAARKGICPEPKHIRTVSVPVRIPQAWTIEQLHALLGAAGQLTGYYTTGIPRALFWEGFLRVTYDTGLRKSDVLSLPVDIVRSGDVRIIQQKTGVEIVRRLNPRTIEVCRKIVWPERELLFPWALCREQFWVHWRRLVLGPSGLPRGRMEGPQKLRRTSATHLEAALPGSASRHLGHATPGLAAKHYIDPTIAYGQSPLPPELD